MDNEDTLVTLDEQLEGMTTRSDFALFVRNLRLAVHARPEWLQNTSIDDYLESMEAWVEDMLEIYYKNKGLSVPEPPDWRLFGEILLGAAVYE